MDKIRPKIDKSEKEISPTSIAGKMGWKRARTVEQTGKQSNRLPSRDDREGINKSNEGRTVMQPEGFKQKALQIIKEKFGQEVIRGILLVEEGLKKSPELKLLLEKLIYLGLKGDERIKEYLVQLGGKIENIKLIEGPINQIIEGEINQIVESLKGIEDAEVFKIERSRKVAELLINEVGELNFFMIDLLKAKLPKSVSGYYEEEFEEILDKLMKNDRITQILTSIDLPKDPSNKAHQYIRATLKLSLEKSINVGDARRAVLSALLMDLRQSNTASCFTTGVAIRIHSTQQESFLLDMKNLIENGCLEKFYNGEKIRFTWSGVPVEEIGFTEEMHEADEAILAAVQGLGIESGKEAARTITKQVYHENDRLFEFNEELVLYRGKPARTFEELINALIEEYQGKECEEIFDILEKIKKQEKITSLGELLETINKEGKKILDSGIVDTFTETKLANMILFLEKIKGIKENSRRFEYKGELFMFLGVPVCSYEGLISKLLTNTKIKKSERLVEVLEGIKKQGEILSIDMLISKVIEKYGSSIEDIILGEKIDPAIVDFIGIMINLKESKRESTRIQKAIEKIAMQIAGITVEDLQDRKRLKELSNVINTFSEQVANNAQVDQELEQKIDEYYSLAKRLIQSEKGIQLSYFDSLISYAKTCYASRVHNLLLRGWEYGLAGVGRIVEKRSPITGELLVIASDTIYDSLFGESHSDKKTFYGIDRKVGSLIGSNQALISQVSIDSRGKGFLQEATLRSTLLNKLEREFLKKFEKLVSERIRMQYQYGGFVLYDTTSLDNMNEIQILNDPKQLQRLLSGLALEAGFGLKKDFEAKYSNAIAEIVDELSQYVKSHDFFEHFVRKISNRERETLKPSAKIPEKINLNKFLEGGYVEPLLRTYYDTAIETIRIKPKNAEDLLTQLIVTTRELKLQGDKKLRIPIASETHVFLFMPNHDSFRKAIDSDSSPSDWVKTQFMEDGKKIVFADTNWDSGGLRRFFVFTKNNSGEIILDCIDEKGNSLGGINELGIIQESMNQNDWVNNKIWELYIV